MLLIRTLRNTCIRYIVARHVLLGVIVAAMTIWFTTNDLERRLLLWLSWSPELFKQSCGSNTGRFYYGHYGMYNCQYWTVQRRRRHPSQQSSKLSQTAVVPTFAQRCTPQYSVWAQGPPVHVLRRRPVSSGTETCGRRSDAEPTWYTIIKVLH